MRVLVAGDYSPRGRVTDIIQNGNTTDILSSVRDYISDAEYSIVNFECSVANAMAKPITKFGSNLRCDPDSAKVLKDAGFNCVTLANNHFRDFGDEGVTGTIAAVKEYGLDYVGGGIDINEAQQTLYKNVKNVKLAILNVCENEFSIANEYRGGSAPLDIVDVAHRIKKARYKASFVLVIIHGGHEHYQYPSPRMKKWYRFLVEEGADAIVNHHQHCFSGYEVYMGKPIFYGIGNFCFDRKGSRSESWNEGYMVALNAEDGKIGFELIPYTQCDESPTVEPMKGEKLNHFWKTVAAINHTISDDNLLNSKYEEFIEGKLHTVLTPFTPYASEYARVAAGRHYLPLLINKNKMAQMMNFVICESHRDVLTRAMQDFIE